jgi:hypothetical protein
MWKDASASGIYKHNSASGTSRDLVMEIQIRVYILYIKHRLAAVLYV